MAVTTLYITRHGQTEWNVAKRMQGHKDSPLTALGAKQARQLGVALQTVHIDTIYCSSSERALQTARFIAGNRPIPVESTDALWEIGQGVWEGMTIDAIDTAYPTVYRLYRDSPTTYQPLSGAESFHEVKRRVVAFVEEAVAANAGKSLLIVTHTIPVKLLLHHFEGRSLEKLWDDPFIHPTSLSKIVIDENGQPVIEVYANTGHFGA